MFCVQCGAEIVEDANFCVGCGRSLKNDVGLKPKRKIRLGRIVLGLVVIVVAFAFIFDTNEEAGKYILLGYATIILVILFVVLFVKWLVRKIGKDRVKKTQ